MCFVDFGDGARDRGAWMKTVTASHHQTGPGSDHHWLTSRRGKEQTGLGMFIMDEI